MRRNGVLYLGGFAAVLAALLLAGSRAGNARARSSPAPVTAVAAAPRPATMPHRFAEAPQQIAEAATPRRATSRHAAAAVPAATPAGTPGATGADESREQLAENCPPVDRLLEGMRATSRTGLAKGPMDVKEEGDRWAQWFYGQRQYPAKTIPPNAMGNAYGHAITHNTKGQGKSGAATTLSTQSGSQTAVTRDGLAPLVVLPSWSALGPSQIPDGQTDTTVGPRTTVSGRVAAIAVDPTNPDVVYVGGAQGGVWKSVNATAASPTWTPLTDSQPSLAVGAIAIDPANTQIVYVGTGEANGSCDSYYGQGILRSTDGGATWTQLGGETGGPFAGQSISKIIVDFDTAGSTNATTLWASTALGFLSSGTEQCALATGVYNGAVWRSDDSGNTWTRLDVPASLAPPGARVHDMVLDPTDSNVLYAAVRSVPVPADGGIWKSTNARASTPVFTKLAGGFPSTAAASPGIRRITLGIGGPSAPGSLYAALESASGSALWGFYRSSDGGAHWSHVDAGQNGTGAIGNNNLTRQSGPLFDPSMVGHRLILGNVVSRTVTRVVNKNVIEFSGPNVTPAAHASWSVGSYPNYCDGQCFYDMTVGVDPHDADGKTVYVGGNPHALSTDLNDSAHRRHTLWVTTNGGDTWGSVSQGDATHGGIHTDDHAVEFDANTAGRVYDGNDGGLWRSDDGGATWTDLNTNLAITQFQSVALHPSDTSKVLGGTQDNGTDLHDAATGVTPPAFFHSDDGDGGQSLFDQLDPAIALHTYFNQAPGLIGPAIDLAFTGGESGPSTWFFAGGYLGYGAKYQNGFDPNDRMSFYVPMANNPASSAGTIGNNPVYVGSNKLYRSPLPLPWFFNAYYGYPPAWTPVSPDISRNDGADYLSAIAPFPGTIGGFEVVYTGSAEGSIQVSKNVDPNCTPPGPCVADWTAIDDAGVLPNRFVTEMEVDATDATGNTVYATFSGFNVNTPTRPGHVFVTTDGLSGTPAWTDISGDLPDVPVNCIALDPSTGTIYVGTDIGVFQTTDGGSHWDFDNDSFPTVSVFGLDRNPNTGQIVASTHGRGMFQLVPPI